MRTQSEAALSADDVASFVREGYVRIDNAFDARTAEQGRAILWKATGCDPDDRTTWTRAVVRLDQFSQAPFREAANTPKLHAAFDQLIGPGRWYPRDSLGTFPVRFPSRDEPSCLVPAFDGASSAQEWKDVLWDRFYTGAPARQRRSVERYSIVKRA